MRAFIIIALALIASVPAMAQDDDEDVSGVRVGNQAIWSDGTVTPILPDDPTSSSYDSDRTSSQRGYGTYDSDDSSHQRDGTTYLPDGRACRVIGNSIVC